MRIFLVTTVCKLFIFVILSKLYIFVIIFPIQSIEKQTFLPAKYQKSVKFCQIWFFYFLHFGSVDAGGGEGGAS